jgi:hypothetical protein
MAGGDLRCPEWKVACLITRRFSDPTTGGGLNWSMQRL